MYYYIFKPSPPAAIPVGQIVNLRAEWHSARAAIANRRAGCHPAPQFSAFGCGSAAIPSSSRNPHFLLFCGSKPRQVLRVQYGFAKNAM